LTCAASWGPRIIAAASPFARTARACCSNNSVRCRRTSSSKFSCAASPPMRCDGRDGDQDAPWASAATLVLGVAPSSAPDSARPTVEPSPFAKPAAVLAGPPPGDRGHATPPSERWGAGSLALFEADGAAAWPSAPLDFALLAPASAASKESRSNGSSWLGVGPTLRRLLSGNSGAGAVAPARPSTTADAPPPRSASVGTPFHPSMACGLPTRPARARTPRNAAAGPKERPHGEGPRLARRSSLLSPSGGEDNVLLLAAYQGAADSKPKPGCQRVLCPCPRGKAKKSLRPRANSSL